MTKRPINLVDVNFQKRSSKNDRKDDDQRDWSEEEFGDDAEAGVFLKSSREFGFQIHL